MLTGSEIAVIIIIVLIVIFVRRGSNKYLDDKFKSLPRIQEIRDIAKQTKQGIVYTDSYSSGKTVVFFKDYNLPDIDLKTARELAQYIASAMPVGTRYALIKKRAESIWRPSRTPSSVATVVINSYSATVYEGTASDAPSRGKQIGWGFFATKKRVSGDGTGDVEYHRV